MYTTNPDYDLLLAKKTKSHIESGFDVELSEMPDFLFDFQKYVIKVALKKGKFAIFEDCGLGKTAQELVWAFFVAQKTGKRVLILAPLAVVAQTKREGVKFGIDMSNIDVLNFEQLKNIDPSIYGGVVLDESSILKGKDGKLSTLIIESFARTPYKLAATATPSPNDHMELGQHAEFLGAMSYIEMLAMYFVHDGGETSKWRLRQHATDAFWKFVCTWSISLDNPKTLGFCGDNYNLPNVHYIEHIIPVENNTASLFADNAISATEIHQDFKRTFDARLAKTVELVNSNDENWIVWGLKNEETDAAEKAIYGSVNVEGSDTPQYKADMLNGFANDEYRVLITKTSIAAMGMNFQNSNHMVFMAYDFKFEQFYQAVRRQLRFGQQNEVFIHLLVPESQLNVRASILEKEAQHKDRTYQMSFYSSSADYGAFKEKSIFLPSIKTDSYHVIHGDCVTETAKLFDNSVDLCVFSPPFAELYVYSDSPNDMGNVSDYKQFEEHFSFLIPQIKRVLKSGRICGIHCMDLPIQKGKEGFIGLRDFSGMIIKWFTEQGFVYHARTTIWKNPVTEMQRTKALGLLHKTIKKDSAMSRVGIPDYVLFFRNEGDNEVPITHQDTDERAPNYLPVDLWQKYASPVWMDIDYSRTLQYRSARAKNDEKHICPLQLDTIERIIHLYSNEGETVFSPFGGIGSEGFSAIKMNRRSVSIELKKSYFEFNAKNHKAIVEEKNSTLTLF
jgi:DNA modification methylase